MWTDSGGSGSLSISTGSAALFGGSIGAGDFTGAFPTSRTFASTTTGAQSGTTIVLATNAAGTSNGSDGTFSYDGTGTLTIGGVLVPAFTARPCGYIGP